MLTDKLHRALTEAPLGIKNDPGALGVSIGVTLLHDQSGSAVDALREASMAMHRAEEAGRNRIVIYDDGMRCSSERRLLLEGELSSAIRSAGITAFVQPQYSQAGGVTGAELLARWYHPSLGAISPTEFIPLAREIGEMEALTDAILARACSLAADLDRLGEHYPISVNISPEVLMNPSFVDSVGRRLSRTGTAGERLVFEVTEDIQMGDLTVAIRQMTALGALGIRFSMDDFGTGYSNLASLRKLPLYELKIDKTLVDGIHESPDAAALADLIVATAQRLGLRIVAEGVENAGQAEHLFAIGADAIQGYWVARPMPIEQWLSGQALSPVPVATVQTGAPSVRYGNR